MASHCAGCGRLSEVGINDRVPVFLEPTIWLFPQAREHHEQAYECLACGTAWIDRGRLHAARFVAARASAVAAPVIRPTPPVHLPAIEARDIPKRRSSRRQLAQVQAS